MAISSRQRLLIRKSSWIPELVWRLLNVNMVCRDGFSTLETAIQAREKGLIGHISISSHSDPQILVEALDRFPFDSVLIATSALDHFILSFVEEFLPIANQKSVATIGMKVMGLGSLAHDPERALRYAL